MNENVNTKQQIEIYLKHIKEDLYAIRQDREKVAEIIKMLKEQNLDDDQKKQELEVWKQAIDEHSKITIEHLKMLEENLKDTKNQYQNIFDKKE